MAGPYVTERQAEAWSAEQIKRDFERRGFQCKTYPMSQRLEPAVPADYIFGLEGRVRIFGLQFKALYPSPDHWRLERGQHATLQKFPWIYYGLSEVKSGAEEQDALELLRLKNPAFQFQSRLYRDRTGSESWSAAQRRLLRGDWGEPINDAPDFINLFVRVWDEPLMVREGNNMADLFLANIDSRRIARVSLPPGAA
jgi:hypothetical protein